MTVVGGANKERGLRTGEWRGRHRAGGDGREEEWERGCGPAVVGTTEDHVEGPGDSVLLDLDAGLEVIAQIPVDVIKRLSLLLVRAVRAFHCCVLQDCLLDSRPS